MLNSHEFALGPFKKSGQAEAAGLTPTMKARWGTLKIQDHIQLNP